MRLILSLTISLAVTIAGWVLFIYLVLFATGSTLWLVAATGYFGTIGAVWVWADLTETVSQRKRQRGG